MTKMETKPKWDYDEFDTTYVLNDEYVEFRKALAEGKTVEKCYYHSADCPRVWEPMREDHFRGMAQTYRIKPDEPQFKVGDWVRSPNGMAWCVTKTNLVHGTEHFIQWEPLPSEWCVIPNPEGGYIVGRYKVDICTARDADSIMPLEFLQTLKTGHLTQKKTFGLK